MGRRDEGIHVSYATGNAYQLTTNLVKLSKLRTHNPSIPEHRARVLIPAFPCLLWQILYVPSDHRRREFGPQAYRCPPRICKGIQAARDLASGLSHEQVGLFDHRRIDHTETGLEQDICDPAGDCYTDFGVIRTDIPHQTESAYEIFLHDPRAPCWAGFYISGGWAFNSIPDVGIDRDQLPASEQLRMVCHPMARPSQLPSDLALVGNFIGYMSIFPILCFQVIYCVYNRI